MFTQYNESEHTGLAAEGLGHPRHVALRPEQPNIVCSALPDGSLLYLRRGRGFAIRDADTGILMYRNAAAGTPSWLADFLNSVTEAATAAADAAASAASAAAEKQRRQSPQVRRVVRDDGSRILALWQENVQTAESLFPVLGGETYARTLLGGTGRKAAAAISVLDSYAAGNCIGGSRLYVNEQFGGRPNMGVEEFLAADVMRADWHEDKQKILAWATVMSHVMATQATQATQACRRVGKDR